MEHDQPVMNRRDFGSGPPDSRGKLEPAVISIPSWAPTREMDEPDRILWLGAPNPSLGPERLAEWCNYLGRIPHLIFCPRTGVIVEMTPPDRTNHLFPGQEATMYAVMVAGGTYPFTDAPQAPRDRLLRLLPPVPDVWPLGPPGEGYAQEGKPSRPGHYAAQQVTTKYPSVGAIDINRLRRNS